VTIVVPLVALTCVYLWARLAWWATGIVCRGMSHGGRIVYTVLCMFTPVWLFVIPPALWRKAHHTDGPQLGEF